MKRPGIEVHYPTCVGPDPSNGKTASKLYDGTNRDPHWFGWSSAALTNAIDEGAGINQIIMAEIAAGFADRESARQVIPSAIALLNLPWDAAHLAGSAFRRYRQEHKGQKTSPMPDFYIYAHCVVERLKLLTRDQGRASYFPEVELIAPNT